MPLCTCQGHTDGWTDGWTHGLTTPPPSTASTRGLPVGGGAPRLQGGTRAASCAPPARCTGTGGTAQPVSSSRAAAPPAQLGGLGAARSRRGGTPVGTAPSCSPWGWGPPSGAWHKRGALRPIPLPAPCPHSRLRRLLHALGAEAGLGQEGAQQPSRVGVPRGIIAARGRGVRGHLGGVGGGTGGVGPGIAPEEGELLPVHPGLEAQRRVLPEGRHDEAEEQRDADEDGGQDDLRGRDGGREGSGLAPHLPIPSRGAPSGRTCAKNPRVLRRAWSSLLVKRARSCWRVSAQPRSRRPPSAVPRSRSVSCGSSAARGTHGSCPGPPAARGRGSAQAQGGTVCWQGRPRACRGAPSPPAPTSPGSLGSA